ncbi:MAG TPA: hypothetical protein VMN37_08535 [Gemmatimonadales bacterium]|nr:hypothetical protein [Gemmatimonadales bacterium]
MRRWLWVAAAGAVGLASSGLFAGLLDLGRRAFVAAFAALALPLFDGYARREGVVPLTHLRWRWRAGMIGGLVLGAILARNVVSQLSSPGAAVLHGAETTVQLPPHRWVSGSGVHDVPRRLRRRGAFRDECRAPQLEHHASNLRDAEPMTPESWHALLAPLPPHALPRRAPVASAPLLAAGAADAIAGWEDLVVELSAGPAGLRAIMCLIDGEGRLLSASDHVLFRFPGSEPVQVRHESIGGRFEEDGTFNGTCWIVEGPEPEEDEEPGWTMSPRPPTGAEADLLRALVAEVLRRGARNG